MKTTDYPKFSLRIPALMLDKLGYISKYNGRTKNKELEILIRKHIADFEKENGKITYEDMNRLNND
jgi:predicted DNA-binding protein